MLIRLAVTVIFTLSSIVSYPRFVSAQSVAAAEKQLSLDETLERVDQIFDALEELRRGIDVSAYDLEAITSDMQLVDEPSEIVDWVQNNISYEAYAGLLRGARGTVLSRAGNALDQSVLLAGLIKDAGFDARIVRGELSDDQTNALLGEIGRPVAKLPETSLQDFKQGLRDMIEAFALPPETIPTLMEAINNVPEDLSSASLEIPAVVDTLSDALLEQLEGHMQFDTAAAMDELRGEAKDYFWVEYRESAAGPWTAAHPAFRQEDADLEGVRTTETYTANIPDELQHRVRIEVFIKQRRGERIVQSPVMPAWERPAANLVGVPITYFNNPDGMTLQNVEEFGSEMAALDQTKFFMPVFNGQLPADSRFFGLNGFTAPSDVANSPYAALFQTIGGAVNDAATALFNLTNSGDARAAAELVGQSILVTLISPGGEERPIERAIWRQNSGEPRDDSAIRKALATRLTTMVDVGRYPDAYALRELLEWVASYRNRVKTMILVDNLTDRTELAETIRMFRDSSDSVMHLVAYSLFDAGADHIADHSYRSSPTLGMLRFPLLLDNKSVSSFDVLANVRHTFLRGDDGELALGFESNLRVGVWESLAEQAALSIGLTSTSVFAAAADEGIPLRVFSQANGIELEALEISHEMRQFLSRDIENGYLVVLPERAPQALPKYAWWRVDPKNGNTLGYLESGLGGVTVEYLVAVTVSAGIVGAGCYIRAVAPDYNAGNPMEASDTELVNCAIATLGFIAVGAGGGLAVTAGGVALPVVGLAGALYGAVGTTIAVIRSL